MNIVLAVILGTVAGFVLLVVALLFGSAILSLILGTGVGLLG